MAWQLLAAALPAAAKIAGTALSKPRQEDYAPQTDYMKKYLSYIRGRSSSREVMHQAMQPALRVAGKQGRQMQRQVGYDVAKSGLGGSGIEAQMRLSAGQQTQEALATATDKAVAAQTAETARIGQQAAGITAQIGAEEARADQAFKSAESQWKRQLASDVIGAGASLASAGITQAGQLNEAKLMAERSGYFGSGEDVQKMIDQGWTPQMLQQESARVEGQVNTLLGSGVELSDIHAELGLGAGYTGTAAAPVVQDTTETVEGKDKQSKIGYGEGQWAPGKFLAGGVAGVLGGVKKGVETIIPGGKTGLADIYGEKTIEGQAQRVRDIRPVSRKIEGEKPSSVLMAQSDNLAYPTLFPKDPDNPSSDPAEWIELTGADALEEAKRRGEVFEFETEEEAKKFALGSWKTTEEEPVVEEKPKKAVEKQVDKKAKSKREAEAEAEQARKAAQARKAVQDKIAEQARTAAAEYAAKVKSRKEAEAAKKKATEAAKVRRETTARLTKEAEEKRLKAARLQEKSKKADEAAAKYTAKKVTEAKKATEAKKKEEAYKKLVTEAKPTKTQGKDYKQGKGLTAAANIKLYAEDPSMRGKSPEERIKRYEELFINNNFASI